MSLASNFSAVISQSRQLFGLGESNQGNQISPANVSRAAIEFSNFGYSAQSGAAAQNDAILRRLAEGLTFGEPSANRQPQTNEYVRLVGDADSEMPFSRFPLPRTEGRWLGERGNSDWQSNRASVNAQTGNQPVPFRNGFPDFSQWSRGEVRLPNMRGTDADFREADRLFARQQRWFQQDGTPDGDRVRVMRERGNMVWHHHQDERRMQLIPRELNRLSHLGGAAMSRNTARATEFVGRILRFYGMGGRE